MAGSTLPTHWPTSVDTVVRGGVAERGSTEPDVLFSVQVVSKLGISLTKSRKSYSARNIIPIYQENDTWHIGNDVPLESFDDLVDVVIWATDNFDQYQKQLTR